MRRSLVIQPIRGSIQMKQLSGPSSAFPNSLRKAAAVVATGALVGVAFMFSAMVLTALLVLAGIGSAYMWWNTRALRKQMRNLSPRGADRGQEIFDGEVIEGEAIRVDETGGGIRR